MDDKLLKTKDAARILCIHEKTLWKWQKDGKIKAVFTLGGQRRYWLSDINAILQGKLCYDKKMDSK